MHNIYLYRLYTRHVYYEYSMYSEYRAEVMGFVAFIRNMYYGPQVEQQFDPSITFIEARRLV